MFFLHRPVRWLNEPAVHSSDDSGVTLVSEPGTDLWQGTYYGMRRNNAHGLLTAVEDRYFSFTATAAGEYGARFDQCGVLLHQDARTWAKASVENDDGGLLGSVVTVGGWSDWATMAAPDSPAITYRLSRREDDFRLEWALPGGPFHQLRIFHLPGALGPVDIGVYACSPEDGSFTARFTGIELGPCAWDAHA